MLSQYLFGPPKNDVAQRSQAFMAHVRQVDVLPAVANTYATIASGPGIVQSVAGSTAEFWIHSRDEFGNDRGSHGATDNFQVTAVLITDSEGYEDSEGQGLREVPGTIVFDNTLGLHRVQYIADGTWSGARLACM